MAKDYLPVQRDQPGLLPLDMRDWLPDDDLVWFVVEVVEALDTSAFEVHRRTGGAGARGYDPKVLLVVLVYAYCQGVRSSRQVEARCRRDVGFRIACAGSFPDHCTLSRFRAACSQAFEDLFAQVLMVAGGAGLGRFGTVAVDGTKIAANASVDSNRSEQWLAARAVAARVVAEAEQVDAAEDAAGEPVPDRTGLDRTDRPGRIAAALAELEAQKAAREQAAREQDQRAQQVLDDQRAGLAVPRRVPDACAVQVAQVRLDRAVAAQQAKVDRYAQAERDLGRRPPGRPPAPTEQCHPVRRARQALSNAQARARKKEDQQHGQARTLVASTTDPASRLMPTRRGFVQGYNAQVVATSDQLVVAVRVVQDTVDTHQAEPMLAAAQAAADTLYAATADPEHRIGTALLDAGYWSPDNAEAPPGGPDRLIATGKTHKVLKTAAAEPTTGPPPPGATALQAMTHRLRTPEGARLYARRGATVEPAIGNLKKIIDRFSRRGLEAAQAELHLAAAAFNLLKIYRATQATA